MHVDLIVLNLVASLASGAFALKALATPEFLSRSRLVSEGERFYVRMYAARSVPLAFAAGFLPFWYGGVPVTSLLFIAALIQGADALLAIKKKELGMVIGANVGLIIHVLCGLAIW